MADVALFFHLLGAFSLVAGTTLAGVASELARRRETAVPAFERGLCGNAQRATARLSISKNCGSDPGGGGMSPNTSFTAAPSWPSMNPWNASRDSQTS